jgi:molybdopterin converting factor small subunit
MRVTVNYLAQVRRAVGRAEEILDTAADGTLADLIRRLAQEHPSAATMLLDAAGQPSRSLLFFVNDAPLDVDAQLPNPAIVTILAPMAGG